MYKKNSIYKGLTVINLGAIVPFNNIRLHMDIKIAETVDLLLHRVKTGQKIVIIPTKTENINIKLDKELFKYGVIAEVLKAQESGNNSAMIALYLEERCEVIESYLEDGVTFADVKVDSYDEDAKEVDKVTIEARKEALHELLNTLSTYYKDMLLDIDIDDDLSRIISKYCMAIPFKYDNKLKLLACNTVEERYNLLLKFSLTEIERLKLKTEIINKVNEQMQQNQKEYFLREELKAVYKELGEGDVISDFDRYKKKLDTLEIVDEVREKLIGEINKLKVLKNNPNEISNLTTYLDTVFNFPWNISSEDKVDLEYAKEILNQEHYGFGNVKERILEYIAIREFNPNRKAPILCLVGPPGTGKTSIAISIAKALQKKLLRISLGGVRDEADIRGHRRTYLSSSPGRIVKGILQSKVNNPLILFDEIDKLSVSANGDPSAALLEVLDPEQNKSFRDHYLELPIDLSNVFFITTANSLSTIPRPLLDRMDVLEVYSYTDNEKFHIAHQYLYKKILDDYCIKKTQINVTDVVIKHIIQYYVRESGVRQLERKLGELIRKAARYLIDEKRKSVKITLKNLEKFLGKPIYRDDNISKKDEIGIVRGLAYTVVGGCTLQIEVNCMPGKGNLVLTGQLGDVMKESARIALSYIRSIKGKYSVEPEFFDNNDIHIHIPEGATPKDGPSAGITLASALISAIKGIPAKANLCMTGEVTLRGNVLPIGGLKEKILGAKNARITNILVPFGNKKDVDAIDEEIKEGLNLYFVKNMNDVLPHVFKIEEKKNEDS